MTTPEYMQQGAGQGAQTVQGMNPWQQEAAGMTPPPRPAAATPEQMTRGLGNNNPLNIRSNHHNMWRGKSCLLYTSPSPRDRTRSRMPSSA